MVVASSFCVTFAVVDSFRLDMLNITTIPNPSSSKGTIWFVAPLALLMLASLVYSISSKKKKKKKKKKKEDNTGIDTHGSTSDDDEISWKSATDEEDNGLEADAKYAEELQIEEALLASMLAASQKTNMNASSSTRKPSLSSLLKKNKDEEVCKICLEKQEYWQMFKNSTCSHSFCYDCTTKHTTTKIQEKHKTIPCPGINCKSTLDFNTLRLIIPKETVIKWDEFLCESMILESHKLYCPFSTCAALLINDDPSITKTDCPVCRRSFCAVCRVPWHSEFSCKEFGKLNSIKKGKKADEMAVALAKKKKWKKCPSCNYFVEKTEGCVHITCRCKYEFCYDCGAKWSCSHGACRPRS